MTIEITIHPGETQELAELLARLSQHIENGHCLSAILDKHGKQVGVINYIQKSSHKPAMALNRSQMPQNAPEPNISMRELTKTNINTLKGP